MHTRKNEHQGKSAIGANGHFGANGHLGTNGHWGKWALGEMGTRKNELQSKWVLGIRFEARQFDANKLYAVDLMQRQFDARTIWRKTCVMGSAVGIGGGGGVEGLGVGGVGVAGGWGRGGCGRGCGLDLEGLGTWELRSGVRVGG